MKNIVTLLFLLGLVLVAAAGYMMHPGIGLAMLGVELVIFCGLYLAEK